MEVEFVNRRPGSPVRMGYFLSAFEKVAAPGLPGWVAEFPSVMLKDLVRDAELQ
ncbi:hypothetical protein SDC9_209665 [bioreactor metagenome]|uniref:Uncharacterized protein n=1 Tax=bioreactor metagenome TaxID=1076179 RepID=A0A645JGV6_9ZZZZ